MADNKKNVSSGIGIAGVLFLIFLVLKLTKVINWSWWWVCSPIWISLAIDVIIFVILGIAMAVAVAKEKQLGKTDNEIADEIDEALKD